MEAIAFELILTNAILAWIAVQLTFIAARSSR